MKHQNYRLAMKNNTLREEYENLIHRKIRRRYSLSQELALHRKRESAPEEFAEMEDYILLCIREAKNEIYGKEVIE